MRMVGRVLCGCPSLQSCGRWRQIVLILIDQKLMAVQRTKGTLVTDATNADAHSVLWVLKLLQSCTEDPHKGII